LGSADALRSYIGAVSACLRRRARRDGVRGAIKAGAVTVIQRFNSALDVSPHFHTLVADGVFVLPSEGRATFVPVSSPSDEDVAEIAAAVFRRVERKLAALGWDAGRAVNGRTSPLLLALTAAASSGVIATGPRRGRRVLRVRGAREVVDAFVMGRLCAQVEGVQPAGGHTARGE
jgi:hypothetical protein